MFATDERTAVRPEAPSRRLEEIRELEELWSIPEPQTAVPVRSGPTRFLARYRVGLLFAAAWIGFMTVLFAVAPAADPQAAPGWVTNVSGIMLTALLFTPLALINRSLGYGASALAGGCGVALAVSCFGAGHTGFWPSYQLGGFALLAAASGVVVARSLRRARATRSRYVVVR